MAKAKFDCQICAYNFTTVIGFKKHLTSVIHQEKFSKVFPYAVFHRNKRSYTPWIFIMNPNTDPILGLSLMTLCFCSEVKDSFYLCHACEEKFNIRTVEVHISHVNHFLHYFAYSDPNELSFLSPPCGDTIPISLMEKIKKEEKIGSGQLQMLHMPERLFKECSRRNYHQVMFLLHQNKSLSNIFKEIKPERIQIPAYRDYSNRKHPLLGLDYIVECVAELSPRTPLRHYLCTLCRLNLSSSKIISHLLTFQHIYTYLSIWHPTTLNARECYKKDNPDDASTLADFAKQSEVFQGRKKIQRVKLETREMLSVFDASFEEALSKIESITKIRSLMPTVRPGKKLVPSLPGTCEIPTNVKQEGMSEPVTSEKRSLIQNIQNIKEENEEKTTEHSVTPAEQSYRFHCQNCSENFETNALYFKHLSNCEHLENFERNFGAVMDTQTGGCKPHCHTFTFTEPDILCVGVSLVVTILCHQLSDQPVHLCFACEAVFQMKDMNLHMNSEKHILLCLMYQNPWKLPFAWKMKLDFLSLKSLVSKEEGERGLNIKILDVPPCLFPSDTPLNYSKVVEKLGCFRSLLMNGVPQCETFSKLQDNDKFPILGKHFLVKYGQITSGWKFLCLLCERPLSSVDYTGHVFSWEHVVAFLEKIHPGSLDLNNTNEEVLLDLAKQAAAIHPVSNAQEIEFDASSSRHDLTSYSTKIRQLSAVKLRDGKGNLIPSITPKPKLVLRKRREKTPNESNADTKVQSIPNSTEKVFDCAQSAEQVSTEISLPEITGLSTELGVKEDNPSEPSQLEEKESVESSSRDCKSTDTMNPASKRKRDESDMDTSDSDTENLNPKQECLSNPDEEKKSTNLQNVDKTKACGSSNTAVDNSVPCYGSEILSFIQRKRRPAVIGLSEIYECLCNDRAPIYLCKSCHLKFKEEHITRHLSETWHYRTYLVKASKHPLPDGKSWKKDMANLAVYWERSEGHGQAVVVKLTPEEYDKLDSTCEYHQALLIVKKRLAREDINTATDPEPVATSSKTEPSSPNNTDKTKTPDLEQSAVQTMTPVIVSQCLPSTSTTPTLPSSRLSNNGKSFKNTNDGSDSTDEDTSPKMVNAALTGASKSSKPVCTFITTRAVTPVADSKMINTRDNTVDQIQYTTSASCTITGTPKTTTKSVCKFLSPKSATRSMSSPAMTHSKATPTPMLVDPVRESSSLSATAVSNAAKTAPNQQDESVLSDTVAKRKAESETGSEPASKVAVLGNNHSSAKRTTTESSSSQTKLSSAAPATTTLKHSDNQAKSTRKHQKLNVNAASRFKHDDPELGSETLTPTTPNSGELMPVIETSQKAPSKNPHIGVDQLLQVQWENHWLFYCLACLTRLESTNHVNTTAHQINCVKLKFPRWSSKPGDEELSEMVARLQDNEKTLKKKLKRVNVSSDVYEEIKSLPDDKAIERAKGLLKRKSSTKSCQRRPSALTSVACNIATSPNISVSPCNVTSPDLGKDNCQNNTLIKGSAQPIKPLPVSAMCASSSSPPVHKPTSIVAPRIIKGSTTDVLSYLSRIMAVKDISVIGLCLVWECRVVPPKYPTTFYLCESCSQTIPISEICDHMTSTLHHYNYLTRQYPHFMYWTEEELPQYIKIELTNYTADLVKGREESVDAQTVLLSEECFESVRHASFSYALNVVQKIKEEKKTTSLSFITMPQQEESQMQLWSLDSSNIHTDLTNQMESSTIDMEHECDADSCASDTDSMHSPLTDFLNSQSPSFISLHCPKQPDEPPNEPPYSAAHLNLAVSPKNEDQEPFESKACSDDNSPLSHDLAVISTMVDTLEATSSVTLEDISTDTNPKADILLCSPSNQESSTVSLNLLENVTKAVEEDQMTEECLPPGHSETSSTVDHSGNENPSLDPPLVSSIAEDKAALDKHYYLLLINLLKQTKNSKQLETSTRNQTSQPRTAKSPLSNVELCEAPKCVRRDVEHPPKTDADVAAGLDNIVTENEAYPSGTGVLKKEC